MLHLEHINWSLSENDHILNDLNFSVPKGRLVVVTGPNGGGKTSLAKVIAGLIPGVQGKIYLNGQDITGLDMTERAKLGISFAFQQPVRFKGISVRTLLDIAAGRSLSLDECCLLLGKVGLCAMDYMNREVDGKLSGGEIKRVEIATVLARNGCLSVFDEPEAGIDIWSFNGLVAAFEQLKSENHTMIIISHQERILNIADDIAVVADGSIREYGPKNKILPLLLEGEITGQCPVGKKVRV